MFFIFKIIFLFLIIHGLYEKGGILRFVNSDREACLDYTELFELNSAQLYSMNIVRKKDINLLLNQVENNN